MSKSKKERCEYCDKILRMSDTVSISGKIDKYSGRNSDGTLKRSRSVVYKKVCVNPLCPGPPDDGEEE